MYSWIHCSCILNMRRITWFRDASFQKISWIQRVLSKMPWFQEILCCIKKWEVLFPRTLSWNVDFCHLHPWIDCKRLIWLNSCSCGRNSLYHMRSLNHMRTTCWLVQRNILSLIEPIRALVRKSRLLRLTENATFSKP